MTPARHTLSDFDFELPPSLIAQQPASERSASRLLDGRGVEPADRVFRDLPGLLEPGDLLVFNDTKVIKARLFGRKDTGGAVELWSMPMRRSVVLPRVSTDMQNSLK